MSALARPKGPIKVLIVDDSAAVRRALTHMLNGSPALRVVGSAASAPEAWALMKTLAPDVLTLDIEMAPMDGLEFLALLRAHCPTPAVVVSSRSCEPAVLERARALGATAWLHKPSAAGDAGPLRERLIAAVLAAVAPSTGRIPTGGTATVTRHAASGSLESAEREVKLIAIGASTGGPQAIEAVLETIPLDAPGIVIVQHMPADYTGRFADRLSALRPSGAKQAEHGDAITPGSVLIAPGGRHLEVRRIGNGFRVHLNDDPPCNGHRPSVDVMFRSVARWAGRRAIGAILTGMGDDGALGLLAMRESGAHTIGEAESSCVVYGMPRRAAEVGACERVLPLTWVGSAIRKGYEEEQERAPGGR